MARTTITPTEAPAAAPLTTTTLTWTAGDVANGNQFAHTGREVLLAKNTGVGARTITFQSKAIGGREDPLDNIAISIAAAGYRVWGPFDTKGWKQADNFVYFDVEHAEVQVIVLRMPAG